MNWAIIGLGFISSRHINAIKETGGKLLMACDIDGEKRHKLEPDVMFFNDYKSMAKSPFFQDIDYLAICTPNYLHHSMLTDPLLVNKKILCEKPLTIDDNFEGLGDVKTVLQLRYNPKVEQIKKSLKKKDNYIKIIVGTYREPEYWNSWKGNPKLSGGMMMNMGIHYLDLLIHLLGKPLEGDKRQYLYTVDEGSMGAASISFEKGEGFIYIEFFKKPCEVIRTIEVNGEKMDLEGATIPLKEGTTTNLHTEVYKAFIKGDGIPVEEARKSLDLLKRLKV